MRRPGETRSNPLIARVLSGLVLAPVALAAVYFGSPYLDVFAGVAALIMAWEWGRLCGGGEAGASGVVLMVAVVAAVAAVGLATAPTALIILACGGVAVLGSALRAQTSGGPLWLAAGVPYIGIPCVALAWLGSATEDGRMVVFWLFAVVWAVDCGGYLFGRLIGGPRLAPAISPNKTWAGLAGGVACAGAAGAAAAALLGKEGMLPLVLLSSAMGLLAQAGDLAESAVKRHFQVKDASNLIPGHGGLLDRADGLLAVLVAVASINLLGGRSVLAWL